MITEHDIDSAYSQLFRVLDEHSKISIQYINAKAELKNKTCRGVIAGTIQGKNDFERDASIYSVLQSDVEQVQELQKELEHITLDLELAKNEVERVRALLRLMEVQVITPKK